MKIGNTNIGENHPTYIIAEIGSNHNGNFFQALALIDHAIESGADAVKFQIFQADKLNSKFTPEFTSMKGQDVYELMQSLETPREWIPLLSEYCTKRNIHFLSTPFDFEAVDILKEYVPAFKISSFELGDLELIEYVAKTGKPLILSTGMANLSEINDAVQTVRSVGDNDIALLHCTSLYPTPMESVNLKAIQTMKTTFNLPIGFSDHTLGTHIAVASVAMGACIIEKHITLDKTQNGPDHSFAIEPEELKYMVTSIRDLYRAFGDGIKQKSPAENEPYYNGRRSIHAKSDIPVNTLITRDMLVMKRPGYGIEPKYINYVVGRKTRCPIQSDRWIVWDMICPPF